MTNIQKNNIFILVLAILLIIVYWALYYYHHYTIFFLSIAGVVAGLVNYYYIYLNLPLDPPQATADKPKGLFAIAEVLWEQPHKSYTLALSGYVVIGMAGSFLTPLINEIVTLKGNIRTDHWVLFGYGIVFGYGTNRILSNVLGTILAKINAKDNPNTPPHAPASAPARTRRTITRAAVSDSGITQDFLNKIQNLSFGSAADIDQYFINNYQSGFIDWFNTNVASQGAWGSLSIDDTAGPTWFTRLWSTDYIPLIFSNPSIGLLQFLTLQSIIINETGGKLSPVTELIGTAGHPGIAYLFDAIAGLKRSYNTLPGNSTCYDLFNNANYNKAFSGYALADTLMNTTDPVWQGEAYPQDTEPFADDPNATGYILQADFAKFRGRGLIQTTGRANYLPLIGFITSYSGSNQVVNNAKTTWTGWSDDPQIIATISGSADWTDLFMNSDLLIPAQGISSHNQANQNYLGGIDGSTPDTANSTILNAGNKINGGNYANILLSRVTQIIETM